MEKFEVAQELMEIREHLTAAQEMFVEISRTLASHRAVIERLVANETAARDALVELSETVAREFAELRRLQALAPPGALPPVVVN